MRCAVCVIDLQGADGGASGVDVHVDVKDLVGGLDAVQCREGDVGKILFGTVGYGGAFTVPGAEFDGVGVGCVEGGEFGVVGEGRFDTNVDLICWFAADGLLPLLRRRGSGAWIRLRWGALFVLVDYFGNLILDVLWWAR